MTINTFSYSSAVLVIDDGSNNEHLVDATDEQQLLDLNSLENFLKEDEDSSTAEPISLDNSLSEEDLSILLENAFTLMNDSSALTLMHNDSLVLLSRGTRASHGQVIAEYDNNDSLLQDSMNISRYRARRVQPQRTSSFDADIDDAMGRDSLRLSRIPRRLALDEESVTDFSFESDSSLCDASAPLNTTPLQRTRPASHGQVIAECENNDFFFQNSMDLSRYRVRRVQPQRTSSFTTDIDTAMARDSLRLSRIPRRLALDEESVTDFSFVESVSSLCDASTPLNTTPVQMTRRASHGQVIAECNNNDFFFQDSMDLSRYRVRRVQPQRTSSFTTDIDTAMGRDSLRLSRIPHRLALDEESVRHGL